MPRPSIRALLFLMATAIGAVPSAAAEQTAARSGVKAVSEYTEIQKVDGRRQVVRTRVEYNWDDGLVYSYRHDEDGELIDVHTSTNGLRPDDAELKEAFDLVWNDSEVRTIRSRQAGLEINGGFIYREPKGRCAAPARCIQVFLFDAENVVRIMLVDLRTRSIADRNYIPPRNREAE